MTAATSPEASVTDPSLARYARVAGIAMLLTIIFGALGEAYIPGKLIVKGDAAATAANILTHPMLFRMGFATYLVEGICDIALCVIFYVLLKPVNRNLALISAFFGIASMITFAIAMAAYFASSFVLVETSGMGSFTPDQRNAMALLCMRISAMIATLFLCLYGIATTIRGYLIMRSGYFPRVFGVLFIIGGIGFFLRTWTYILVPAYSSELLLIPMALAGIPFMLWLLVRTPNFGVTRSEGARHSALAQS
jgi:hypothetical protein